MVFDNPKVNLGVAPEGGEGLCFDFVAGVKDELELLLVDGGGSQEGRLKAGLEPVGDVAIGLEELLCRLLRMLYALVLTVAQCNLAVDDFSFLQAKASGIFL